MREKLRALRAALGLSQATFAEKIGLKQKAIADVETGRNKLTTRNFDNICRAFNVNPDWLRDGVGEMFLPEIEKSALDLFAEENNLTAADVEFISTFANLPLESRAIITAWLETFAANVKAENE